MDELVAMHLPGNKHIHGNMQHCFNPLSGQSGIKAAFKSFT